jgi:hypothetical protein
MGLSEWISIIPVFLYAMARAWVATCLRAAKAFFNGQKRSIVFSNSQVERKRGKYTVEVTKALAALRPLYGMDNVEIVTTDGSRIRGIVRSMKTTQALTTPSVKIERAGGEIIKIPFLSITEIIDHNPAEKQMAEGNGQKAVGS